MRKPTIKLNYGQIQIPQQEEQEDISEDYWIIIKEIGQRYRRQQIEKQMRKRKWCWGLSVILSIAVIALVYWVLLMIPQRQFIDRKQNQAPDSSLNNEPQVSPKENEHNKNINAKGPQPAIDNPQDQNNNDRLQALHVSPNVSQVIIQGKTVEQQLDLASVDHLPYKQHTNHEKLSFAYPTMGMKKPNTEFDFRIVEESFYYDYESTMYQFLKPFNDTDCILERLGDQNDGGYPLCTNFLNQAQALVNLGVEGRDRFGCDLTTRKSMPNYQYDCTTSIQPVCPSNNKSNIYSGECLGEKTEQTITYSYVSLKDIIDSRNLTNKHIILKMDIEGGQWPGLRTFPREYLEYIDQIVMEIHNTGRNIHHQPYWGNLNIIEALQEHFIPVYLHMNPGACLDHFSMQSRKRRIPAFAIEVTLVNREIITTKSTSRAYRYKDREQLYGMTFCDPQD